MRGSSGVSCVLLAVVAAGCGARPAAPPRAETGPDAGEPAPRAAPADAAAREPPGEPASEPGPVLGWVATFGGLDDEWPGDLAATPEGGAVLGGAFFGEVDLDPSDGFVPVGSAGGLDGLVAAFDERGGLRWAGGLGGPGEDRVAGVALLDDGSVAVAGTFTGTADLDPGPGRAERTSTGGEDGLVALLDPRGELEWALAVGGPGDDGVEDVAVGPGGDLLVVGQFYDRVDLDPGPGTDVRRAAGGRDVFVLRLDRRGGRRWAAVLGGPGEDFGSAAAFAPDGGVVVGGRFDQRADFDPGPGRTELVSTGHEDDAWLARLEPDGSLGWARSFGGPGRDVVRSLAVGPDGSIVAVGGFHDVADLDPGTGVDLHRSRGGRDVFVVRLDRTGALLWARSLGGPADDWVEAVALSAAGGLALCGSSDEKVDFDPGRGVAEPRAAGGRDAFVLRLEPDAAFGWLWTVGGPGTDFALSVSFAPDGSLLAGGGFTGAPDFDPGPASAVRSSAGRRDGFVVRLSDGQ